MSGGTGFLYLIAGVRRIRRKRKGNFRRQTVHNGLGASFVNAEIFENNGNPEEIRLNAHLAAVFAPGFAQAVGFGQLKIAFLLNQRRLGFNIFQRFGIFNRFQLNQQRHIAQNPLLGRHIVIGRLLSRCRSFPALSFFLQFLRAFFVRQRNHVFRRFVAFFEHHFLDLVAIFRLAAFNRREITGGDNNRQRGNRRQNNPLLLF